MWSGIDQSDIFRQWKLFVTLLGPRTRIRHGLQRLTGCILPTMHCRSQHCWKLLHLFAHHCQHVRNNSQIVGATMLGVVASVCTQPNKENCHLKLYVFCLSCPSAAFALQPGGFVPRELLAAKGLLFLSQTQFIFCFLYNNCYIFFHKKNFENLLKKTP